MKTAKKILAVILSALMVMSLALPAFAATDFMITVENDNPAISIDGSSYSAYKLFDVTYADTDADGENDAYAYTIDENNQFFKDAAAKAIIEKYFTLTETSVSGVYNVVPKSEDDFGRALGDELQSVMSGKTAEKSAAASGESAVICDLPSAGYYIVTGSAKSTDEAKETVTAAVALTTTEPAATISAKADVPGIEKTVGEEDKKAASYDIGDTVPFTITSAVPATDGYEIYKFIIHDVMSSGLTFDKDSVVVTIGGDVLGKNTDYSVAVNTADGCTFEVQIADLLKKADGERKWSDGDEIVVTYTATLNEGALTTDAETNSAVLEYSNDPFHSSPDDEDNTGETPESKAYVYDFEIDIDKYTGTYDGETTEPSGDEPSSEEPSSEEPAVSKRYYVGTGVEEEYYLQKDEDGYFFVMNRPDINDLSHLVSLTPDTNGFVTIPTQEGGIPIYWDEEKSGSYSCITYDFTEAFADVYLEDADYVDDIVKGIRTRPWGTDIYENCFYSNNDLGGKYGEFTRNADGDLIIDADYYTRYTSQYKGYGSWLIPSAPMVLKSTDFINDWYATYDAATDSYIWNGTTNPNEAAKFYCDENGHFDQDIVIGNIEDIYVTEDGTPTMDIEVLWEIADSCPLPEDFDGDGYDWEFCFSMANENSSFFVTSSWDYDTPESRYANADVIHNEFDVTICYDSNAQGLYDKKTGEYVEDDDVSPRIYGQTNGGSGSTLRMALPMLRTLSAAPTTAPADTCKRLSGAKFVLTNNEGKFYKYENNDVAWIDDIADATEVITDGNGAAQFKGVKEGVYFLRETEAPAGYNLLTEDTRVVITAEYNEDGTVKTSSATLNTAKTAYIQVAAIENNTGRILPSTGGIGTPVIYTFALLLLAAFVVLASRRKESAAEA